MVTRIANDFTALINRFGDGLIRNLIHDIIGKGSSKHKALKC